MENKLNTDVEETNDIEGTNSIEETNGVEGTNSLEADAEKISEKTVGYEDDKPFYERDDEIYMSFDERDDEKAALRFKVLGIPTIIYSIVYGICLYKNLTGIMTPVFTIATVVYLWFVLPGLSADMALGKEKRKRLIPYFTGIILLGISVFMTSDMFIIFWNYVGIILLTMTALIRFFCDEAGWGVVKYILAMLEVALVPLFHFHMFFSDRKSCKTPGKNKIKINKNVKYVIIGIIVAIPFLIVVTFLLACADVIFYIVVDGVFDRLFHSFHISWDAVGFIILILCVLLLVYGLMCRLSACGAAEYELPDKKCNPITGITFCGALTAVYLLFSCIQILSLFMGERMLPAYHSYSSYAREGFYELLYVAALNFFIVLVCNSIFTKHRVLKIVLTIMCGCTYIMIASSAIKLLMYIKKYNLTYLRVLALFALLLIAALMAGVIANIHKHDFKLMRYFIAVTSVLYIALSFAHPDYIIAKYNISKMDLNAVQACDFDLKYLVSNMSCDAAPTIYAFAEEAEKSGTFKGEVSENTKYDMYFQLYFHDIAYEYDKHDGIREFNLSWYRAYLCAKRYRN